MVHGRVLCVAHVYCCCIEIIFLFFGRCPWLLAPLDMEGVIAFPDGAIHFTPLCLLDTTGFATTLVRWATA